MLRKVLIVDDSKINILFLRKILTNDYEVLEAENGEKGLEILRANSDSISAVLLDLSMPVMDGFEVLRQASIDSKLSQIPIIVTTGSGGIDSERIALELGAQDYITKPYDPEIVKHRLANHIKLRENSTIINALRRDKLTGLYTREYFFEVAANMIAEKEDGYFMLSAVDIDNFKVVNDQYGSDEGNKVLIGLANLFRERFSSSDEVLYCRVAADNFALLLPRHFSENDNIGQYNYKLSSSNTTLPIAVSVGRYIIDDKSLGLSAMYDRAKLAKSTVKGHFESHIAIFDISMMDKLLREQEVVNEMNDALKTGQFEVWFQPQYNHATGDLVGAEALVRWRHPTKGLISPGVFIPIFERNGFIFQLDKFVWEQTCIYLRSWLDEGRSPLPVSVNISRRDVVCGNLAEIIYGLVKKYDVPVELLRLEVTESAFAKSADQIITLVKDFISYGFTVEIDDFGSGYSSLNTLKDVPAQIVKLDMKFLEGDENSDRGGSIIESIVRMVKWLGMGLIAEGVETVEQADFLKSIGCNYIQGYLYAKPMPFIEYDKLAREKKIGEKLIDLETVENLDANSFWDPKSIDTLIFNSYVGGSCILEYCNGEIELLRATERFTHMFGSDSMTVADAQRIHWDEYLDQEGKKQLKQAIETSRKTKINLSGEYVFTNLPGCLPKVYLHISMRVIATVGKRCLLYCMCDNMTAQRVAEQENTALAQRLQAVMNSIGSGITAVIARDDGEVEYLFANQRYYDMFGYSQEQYVSKSVNPFDTILPDDKEMIIGTMNRVTKTGKREKAEYRVMCKDGSIMWVRSILSVTHVSDIESPIQLCVYTDITEEKNALQRIVEREEQLSLLNDAAHELLVSPDADAGIQGVLRHILDYFKGCRSYVIEIDHEKDVINNTYEACAKGVKSQREFVQNIPLSTTAKFWKHAFDNSDYILIENIDELDESRKEEKKTLKAQGIHSLVAVPIAKDGHLIGFVGVDDPSCNVSHVSHLQAVGDYICLTMIRRGLIEKVRNNAETLQAIMNSIPGGFVRIRINDDGSFSTEYANQSFCDLRGMSYTEVLDVEGKDALALVHPDDVAILKEAAKEMLTTGETRNVKYRLKHADGSYIPFHVFARITENEYGEKIINAYYAELDNKAKRDLAVRDMLPFFLSANMNSSNDLVFAKDKEFRYICCSPAFAKFAGQEQPDEVIGKTDYELFPKNTADQFRKDDLKLFSSGESLVDYIEKIPSADDIQHYSNTSKYILHDAADEIIGIYGIGRDVTEDRAIYDRLKLLTDNIPGGIASYIVSPTEIKIIYFNDGFCNLLGYSRSEYEEISKSSVLNVTFEEDKPAILAQIDEMMKNGTPLNCTYRIKNRYDDGFKWVNLRGTITERRDDNVYVNTMLSDVTEQKIAEEGLRVHQEEVKLTLSKMSRFIAEFDIETRTLTIPDTYAEKYGYTTLLSHVPESSGKLYGLQDEGLEEYKEFYKKIIRGETPEPIEIRKTSKDGVTHWETLTAYIIFSESGKAVKALISGDNTTEQHVAYELERNRPTLGEKNMLSHALFNLTTKETIEYFDRNERPVPIDKQLGFLGGGKPLSDVFVSEEEREKFHSIHNVERLLKRYECSEREFSIDYRRRLENGEIRWVRNLIRLVQKPGGKDILLFEYCYDIEDEKLRELMSETIVTSNYDYVARVNGTTHNFTIITNESVKNGMPPRSGLDIDVAIREIIENNVHPDDREMALNNSLVEGIKRNLKDQKQFQFVYRVIRPDGTIRYKKLTEYYLDRTIDIIIISREDITQIMEEENTKKEALANALEAANLASHAKTTFLSRMSHELRTPMNAIIGLTALSATELDNQKVMEDNITKIGMSARYLLALINDILEMTRIESGKLTLAEQPFEFESFISNLNTIIYPQAEEKGLDYEVSVEGMIEPTFIGDETKLQEILINILGNAVKFTPSGGKVSMQIKQLRCVKRRAKLRFIISDTGIGIDEKFLPHMFESFSQEQTNVTSSIMGTGLGLAITKNLVEMMDGNISVQSVKNVGSVFTVDVCIGVSEQNQHYLDGLSAMQLDKMHALVVDDDVIVCENAKSILTSIGIKAEWVDSGAKAVERVKETYKKKKDFDAIFIDWKMPDMDGVETTRQIRKIVGPEVTIIIITAYDCQLVESAARAAGADLFLEKPLFQSSIVRTFESLFLTNQSKEAVNSRTSYDFSGKRVLLAEDNALNTEIAKRILEKAGFEVEVVCNGLEAIEAYTTSDDGFFDAILMDIRMPIMDGLTAAKSIRNLKKAGSKTIPIIAMTANAFDEDVEKSIESGMNAHLAKPIEPKIMFATLQRLIK